MQRPSSAPVLNIQLNNAFQLDDPSETADHLYLLLSNAYRNCDFSVYEGQQRIETLKYFTQYTELLKNEVKRQISANHLSRWIDIGNEMLNKGDFHSASAIQDTLDELRVKANKNENIARAFQTLPKDRQNKLAILNDRAAAIRLTKLSVYKEGTSIPFIQALTGFKENKEEVAKSKLGEQENKLKSFQASNHSEIEKQQKQIQEKTSQRYNALQKKIQDYALRYQDSTDPIDIRKKEASDAILQVLATQSSYQDKIDSLKKITDDHQVSHKVLNQFRKSDPTIIAFGKEMQRIIALASLSAVQSKPITIKQEKVTAAEPKQSTISSLVNQGKRKITTTALTIKSMLENRFESLKSKITASQVKPSSHTEQPIKSRIITIKPEDRILRTLPPDQQQKFTNHLNLIQNLDKTLNEVSQLMRENRDKELGPQTPREKTKMYETILSKQEKFNELLKEYRKNASEIDNILVDKIKARGATSDYAKFSRRISELDDKIERGKTNINEVIKDNKPYVSPQPTTQTILSEVGRHIENQLAGTDHPRAIKMRSLCDEINHSNDHQKVATAISELSRFVNYTEFNDSDKVFDNQLKNQLETIIKLGSTKVFDLISDEKQNVATPFRP